mmetsp:Transcript_36438/g.104436  ORF Transcript_36438/g.104436 Transcript_36438/m.104436 type:complete len:270 (+) Transcript_36438:805-1614(+)
MAMSSPYLTWFVGRPLRNVSLSIAGRSSWMSDMLWIISMATAVGMHDASLPPKSSQAARHRMGLTLLAGASRLYRMASANRDALGCDANSGTERERAWSTAAFLSLKKAFRSKSPSSSSARSTTAGAGRTAVALYRRDSPLAGAALLVAFCFLIGKGSSSACCARREATEGESRRNTDRCSGWLSACGPVRNADAEKSLLRRCNLSPTQGVQKITTHTAILTTSAQLLQPRRLGASGAADGWHGGSEGTDRVIMTARSVEVALLTSADE